MVCSMMTMVMPSAARPRSTAITSSASAWPRPASVSSSSRMRGCPASARASSIRRSSLLVSSLATRCAIRGQADARDRRVGQAARLGVRAGAHVGADHHVVGHRHAHERTHDLEGAADAQLRRAGAACRPRMLRPSSSTSPALGARKPFSRLNAVVLPAPFGPMMPRIMPSRTSKPTSSTAFRPPKLFDRPRTDEDRTVASDTAASAGSATSSAAGRGSVAAIASGAAATRRGQRR